MKSFNESLNEIKNAQVSNTEKMNMLLKLGLVKSDCYALFNVWGKETPSTHDLVAYNFRYTFGVEIECFNVDCNALKNAAWSRNLCIEGSEHNYNHTDSNTHYKLVRDASISGHNPIECVSPVLTQDGFESLKNICDALSNCNAKVNRSCGLHVHIGASHLTEAQYANVFQNYKMMERIIDTFMAQSRRGDNGRYCHTLADHNFCNVNTIYGVSDELGFNRYHKVNSESYSRHKTIEFRQHGGTTDYDKISHWVRFCAQLVEWSRTNRLASEINSIDEIQFLNAEDKQWFKNRAENLR